MNWASCWAGRKKISYVHMFSELLKFNITDKHNNTELKMKNV